MTENVNDVVENSANKILLRLAYGVGGLLGMGLFAFSGWVTTECLESRQFRLNGDRYTQYDASRDKAAIYAELSAMENQITRLQVTLERIEKGM
jgi:cell division septal protein FtsQ